MDADFLPPRRCSKNSIPAKLSGIRAQIRASSPALASTQLPPLTLDSSLIFCFSLTDRDADFLLHKVDDRQIEGHQLLHAHLGHKGVQHCYQLDHNCMFCGDICHAWASILQVWSSLRRCRASKRFSACGADFMGPKHHMNTLKCFGMTSSSQTLWIGLFGMLSSYTDCACDAALEGRSPCF